MERFLRMPQPEKNRIKPSQAAEVNYSSFSYTEALKVQKQVKEL